MKTFKKAVLSFELTCPSCGDTLPGPKGSLFWTREELQTNTKDSEICNCGYRALIPNAGRS